MISRIAFGAAAFALAATAVPAAAQEEITFTGPRLEVQAGWDQLKFDLGDQGVEDGPKEEGFGYGVVLGYDVALGTGLVAGIEANLAYSTTDGGFTDSAGLGYTFDTGRELSVAGRLGAMVGPSALIYGKLGYTNLNVGVVSDADATSSSTDLDGIVAGVGAEIAVAPNTFIKGEYSYSDYESDISRHRFLTGIGIRF